MVTCKPARENEYPKFLHLMQQTTSTDLERVLSLIGMTWDQFADRFLTTGKVYSIYEEDELAGFYWAEMRGETLHLHGLVLADEYQGREIGTEVLRKIETDYRHLANRIEFGVDQANTKAKALYKRLGYHVVKILDDVGFYVMQKDLVSQGS